MALLPQDPKTQKLILLGILPLAAAFGYYHFLHTPRASEADVLEARVEKLAAQNDAMRAIVARFGADLPRRLAIYQEHVRHLEQLIPHREDVPRLIYQITERAMDSNVELAVIRPGTEQAGDFYTRQTFELQVVGEYHDIAGYLTAIGSLSRIVRPHELKLTVETPRPDGESSPKLRAAFRIEVYVMPDAVESETQPARTNAST
jgi:type IV pilus assembly protein PilO